MRDPLPPPPAIITSITQPIADGLSLKTLPLHAHEVLLAFCVYNLLHIYLAPHLSTWLCPSTYPPLPPRTKINWNIRVVSTIQALLISSLAIWVILADKERKEMDNRERIWGYTGAMGLTQAFAAGYFLWDVWISTLNLDILGPGSLAHAVSALLITSIGFRPFANYYGVAFVLYALSTPFLNFHWYFDKCKMTGSRVQLYNGIALLVVFFGCRLVWGTYQSVRVYEDILSIIQSPKNTAYDARKELHRQQALPLWLLFMYLGSNSLLTFLNFYWFWRMIATIRKRFPSLKDRGTKIANE